MTDKEILDMLKQVGLNQYESQIYSTLLSSGSLTAGELSSIANVPRSRVYDVLVSLERKGFAIVQLGRPIKYSPISPKAVVEQIKANYKQEYNEKLNLFSKTQDNLLKKLQVLAQGKKVKPGSVTGILRGSVILYGHLKQLIDDSKKSVVKMTNEEGFEKFEKHCKTHLSKAKKRGVKTRVVTKVSDSKKVEKSAQKLKDFAEIRRHEIDGQFFIKDGEEVVLIISPEDTGLWIKSPYVAKYLEKMFERVWKEGTPLGI